MPPHGLGVASLIRVHAPAKVIDGLSTQAGFDVTESRGADWADVIVNGAKQRDALAATRPARAHPRRRPRRLRPQRRAPTPRYTAPRRRPGSPLPSGRTTYRTSADVQEELKELAEQPPRPRAAGDARQDLPGARRPGRRDRQRRRRRRRPADLLPDGHAPRPRVAVGRDRDGVRADAGQRRRRPADRDAAAPASARRSSRSSTSTATCRRARMRPIDPRDNYPAVDPTDENGAGRRSSSARRSRRPAASSPTAARTATARCPTATFPCELQWGVDNNRNYGNLWGGPGSEPGPDLAELPRPGAALGARDAGGLELRRTHQVTALISLHTVAALVLRPPGAARRRQGARRGAR